MAVSHHDATPASGNIEHHIIGRDCQPGSYAMRDDRNQQAR